MPELFYAADLPAAIEKAYMVEVHRWRRHVRFFPESRNIFDFELEAFAFILQLHSLGKVIGERKAGPALHAFDRAGVGADTEVLFQGVKIVLYLPFMERNLVRRIVKFVLVFDNTSGRYLGQRKAFPREAEPLAFGDDLVEWLAHKFDDLAVRMNRARLQVPKVIACGHHDFHIGILVAFFIQDLDTAIDILGLVIRLIVIDGLRVVKEDSGGPRLARHFRDLLLVLRNRKPVLGCPAWG